MTLPWPAPKQIVWGSITILLGILGGLALRAAFEQRDARIQMQAEIGAQGQLIANAKANVQRRAAETAEQKAKFAKVKRETQKPAEILQALPAYLPLPKPIVPAVSAPGLEPPSFELPTEDLKALFDFSVDCQQCKVELAAAKADAADLNAEISALETQRDAAVRAVKGGAFWQRLKRNTRYFVAGAAVGVATGIIVK